VAFDDAPLLVGDGADVADEVGVVVLDELGRGGARDAECGAQRQQY